MKPELIHLLSKLKAAHPDFHSLVIHPNGVAFAVHQHGAIPFKSLDALEACAWPAQEKEKAGHDAHDSQDQKNPVHLVNPVSAPPPQKNPVHLVNPVSPPPPLETHGLHQTPPAP
jgi:hypothetical protein